MSISVQVQLRKCMQVKSRRLLLRFSETAVTSVDHYERIFLPLLAKLASCKGIISFLHGGWVIMTSLLGCFCCCKVGSPSSPGYSLDVRSMCHKRQWLGTWIDLSLIWVPITSHPLPSICNNAFYFRRDCDQSWLQWLFIFFCLIWMLQTLAVIDNTEVV